MKAEARPRLLLTVRVLDGVFLQWKAVAATLKICRSRAALPRSQLELPENGEHAAVPTAALAACLSLLCHGDTSFLPPREPASAASHFPPAATSRLSALADSRRAGAFSRLGFGQGCCHPGGCKDLATEQQQRERCGWSDLSRPPHLPLDARLLVQQCFRLPLCSQPGHPSGAGRLILTMSRVSTCLPH